MEALSTLRRSLGRDDLVWLLGSLANFYRIPFDGELLAAQYPPPLTRAALHEAARALGLKTGAGALPVDWTRLPLPCIAFLRSEDGNEAVPILILKTDGARLLYFRPGVSAPETLAAADAPDRLEADLILVAREAACETRNDIPGFAADRPAFGFRWFLPELAKHKTIWRDVLLASFALQLVGLATPLFTQVIIDKVPAAPGLSLRRSRRSAGREAVSVYRRDESGGQERRDGAERTVGIEARPELRPEHPGLSGGAGADVLFGGDGNDRIDAGEGDDFLEGGAGDDVLAGGGGDDVYHYHVGDGVDRIVDSGGRDRLVITGAGPGQIVLGVGSLKLSLPDGGELHLDDFDPEHPYDGTVEHVGADAADANAGGTPADRVVPQPPRYKALIALREMHLVQGGERFGLGAGMQANAEIHLGTRTVMEYLLSPVRKAWHEAGRER